MPAQDGRGAQDPSGQGSSAPGLATAHPQPRLSRRGLLGGIALGAGGLLAGTAVGYAAASETQSDDTAEPAVGSVPVPGSTVEPYLGAHQAGIATPVQSTASFVALDLRDDVDRDALIRLMRLLTDDIARLTSGRPALADPTPELAGVPARLTVTVGFGMGLLEAAGLADQAPTWLASGLPPFSVDRLEERWSGGDLLLQVAAEDPVTVSHAQHVLLTDAEPFATVRWTQQGFHRPLNTAPVGITGRNLFGQVDGTQNPVPGTDDFDTVVWVPAGDQPAWLADGSAMVLRRIAMDLPTWGGLDVNTKQAAIGRFLSDGAPLTGGTERSAPDYEAVDENGFLVIPATAHMRLAHPVLPVERILRRPYNYQDPTGDGSVASGLLFVAYMADPDQQYVPMQERLATSDVLNIWTTPIGSALFAIPPGVRSEGEFLGQSLLA